MFIATNQQAADIAI